MKVTPRSTARRSTAVASSRSAGGPQIPGPVTRIAPKPSRLTVRSPPTSIVPACAALLMGRGSFRRFPRVDPLTGRSAPSGARQPVVVRPRPDAVAQVGVDGRQPERTVRVEDAGFGQTEIGEQVGGQPAGGRVQFPAV